MSRVYEALRQSELENGIAATLLDPDTFLASPTPAQTAKAAEVAEPPSAGIAWDEIHTLHPVVREDSRVVALTESNSLAAEKFRLLRARLRNLREHRPLQKLVISSAVPNEGKTMVSMNLAVCLAKHTEEKVLLLEGDLRKPMAGEHLGIKNLPGLGDWALVDQPITKFLCRFEGLQLWVLPSGTIPENPVTILQSARFLELYRQLTSCFDWIIIDAPPLLPMADVSFWSRQADGLLLVVREGKTPKTILQKGLETLDNPKLVGVVLNDAQQVESSYYRSYYYGTKKPAS